MNESEEGVAVIVTTVLPVHAASSSNAAHNGALSVLEIKLRIVRYC